MGICLDLFSEGRGRVLEVFFVTLHVGDDGKQDEIYVVRNVFVIVVIKSVVVNIVLKERRMKRYGSVVV
jgi:hypothetical protein